MAFFLFKDSTDGSGTKHLTTSDPNIVKAFTAKRDIAVGNVIGSGNNQSKIENISVEIYGGEPSKESQSMVGTPYAVSEGIIISVTPVHPDKFELWDEEYWKDITDEGFR